MKFVYIFFLFNIIASSALAQFSDSDIVKAAILFKEVKQIADADNGKLWDHHLYGPMLLVDPKTKGTLANQPDSAGSFKPVNGIYRGTVPGNFAFANTAQHWQGKVWTVVLWPIPEDRFDRNNLVMHELYHQLQQHTNLPKTDANCQHLETMEGRLLLRLELEAIRKVITDYPNFDKNDLINALTLRSWRYKKFSGADSLERNLELNEGLAEATGLLLSGRTEAEMRKSLMNTIDNFYHKPSFVRSMAYMTGPLYGYLLNAKNKNWYKPFLKASVSIKDLSFGNLLMTNYHLKIPDDIKTAYNTIAERKLYAFDDIYTYEKNREDARLKTLALNKAKFIDGPVLILPNSNMNFVFNPNEVQVIDDHGQVYPTFSGKADWGNLEVKKGGAFIKDWMYVYMPLPDNFDITSSNIKTGDWWLELKNGWKIQKGKRAGDYEVVHE